MARTKAKWIDSEATPSGYMMTSQGGGNTGWAPPPSGFISPSGSQLLDIYDNTGDIDITAGWTDLLFDSHREMSSGLSHTEDEAEIASLVGQDFIVAVRVSTYNTDGTSRCESEFKVLIDTGGGYVDIPGTLGFIYNRNNSQGHGTATVLFGWSAEPGHKIKIQARKVSGGNTIYTAAQGCSVTIWNNPAGNDSSGGALIINGGRNRNNATNEYMRDVDSIPFNVTPTVIPTDTTLVAISVNTTTSNTWDLEVYRNNDIVPVPNPANAIAIVNVVGVESEFDNQINIDLDAGDKVAFYIRGIDIDYAKFMAAFIGR